MRIDSRARVTFSETRRYTVLYNNGIYMSMKKKGNVNESKSLKPSIFIASVLNGDTTTAIDASLVFVASRRIAFATQF
jgi:hypothetical protein